ncbi:hypothetical protein [Nitrosomonas sp. Nm34]|uniref:hypothetical protein n=1 Tax=Nitrosomonas sp. Nm34 TaxID=1881055 RepID=UPI0008E72C6B|nr:hypothetical protein [Nitrosomonas sp. Nm34]SFI17478.1 hypothetical protein SAMN05428978_100152 [Nitrosomonas sp. Nm34]
MDTITIFYASDEFCKEFELRWEQRLLESSLKRRWQQGALCLSEVMNHHGRASSIRLLDV